MSYTVPYLQGSLSEFNKFISSESYSFLADFLAKSEINATSSRKEFEEEGKKLGNLLGLEYIGLGLNRYVFRLGDYLLKVVRKTNDTNMNKEEYKLFMHLTEGNRTALIRYLAFPFASTDLVAIYPLCTYSDDKRGDLVAIKRKFKQQAGIVLCDYNVEEQFGFHKGKPVVTDFSRWYSIWEDYSNTDEQKGYVVSFDKTGQFTGGAKQC